MRTVGKKASTSGTQGKRKTNSHSRSKQVLKDGLKSIHNSQNLKKNKVVVSMEDGKPKHSISKFNNYMNNKQTTSCDVTWKNNVPTSQSMTKAESIIKRPRKVLNRELKKL